MSAPYEPPNIPRTLKDVKQAFVPKNDAFLFFDYKNIEVRLLAYYLSEAIYDTSMAERFREDAKYDPHKETAQLLFGSEITDEQRQVGKTLNFSVIYGGGTPTIMRQLNVDYKTAKKYLTDFHEARPGIKALTERMVLALNQKGYVRNLYGRHGHVKEDHKVLNWVIQSTAADLMTLALVNVDEYLLECPWLENPSSHMVNTIHDELMFDCTIDEIEMLVKDIPVLMIDPRINLIVPITVDIEVSYTTWADKKEYTYE